MKSSLRVAVPSAELIASYRMMVAEFVERGEPLIPFPLTFENDDADSFIAHLEACSRGDKLPPGFVPHSTYWLLRDESEVVGVSNLRHDLTDALRIEGGHIGYGVRPSARRQGCATALLRATLAHAATLGIEEALLTCAAGNAASIATIVGCGGVLLSEDYVESRGTRVRRYAVDTMRGAGPSQA